MQSVVDKDFNEILRSIVPDSILSLNPVIAGGFPLSLFRTLDLHSKPHHRRKLLEWSRHISSGSYIKSPLLLKAMDHFSDIDCWLLNDSLNGSDLEGYLSDKINLNNVGREDTSWSTSFHGPPPAYHRYQIIKKFFDTPSDIINTFDISLCCIAWHDDVLYFTDGFTQSIYNGKLSINNSECFSESDPLHKKVFHSVRLMKHITRGDYEVCDAIHDYILNTYYSIKDMSPSQISNEDGFRVLVTPTASGSAGHDPNYNYLTQLKKSESFSGMVRTLDSMFPAFITISGRKTNPLLYFVGSARYNAAVKTILEQSEVGKKNIKSINNKSYKGYNTKLTNIPF